MVLDSYCTWRVPLGYSGPCWAYRECRFRCWHCGGHNRTSGCNLACWRTSHGCSCSCDAELSWMRLRSQPDVKPSSLSFTNVPAACDLGGFDAGFLLEEEGCLVFSLLVSFTFFPFFVLLTFFTVNSSSSLSAGSLKSSSLSDFEKDLLHFNWHKERNQKL